MLIRLIVRILFVSHIVHAKSNAANSLDPSGTEREEIIIASQCLQHKNHPEAIWLPETGVVQDLGIHQIPDHVQRQILEAICDMNDYFRNSVQSNDACRLVRCQNLQPLCAFWTLQGQCTNENYRTYMETNCPVACQVCHTERYRARAWLDFLRELQQVYQEDGPGDDVVIKRQRVLDRVFDRLDQNRSGNFAAGLVRQVNAVIPWFLIKLYSNEALTEEESDWLRSIHGIEPHVPAHQVRQSTLVQYRERGYMVGIMEVTDFLIVRPIQLSIAFAIPNTLALQTIRDVHMPILEMGAGSGYWAAQLHSLGVPVVAYDAARGPDNAFFNVFYTDHIRQGTCEQVMKTQPELAQTHALLLIWPNDPDPIDNPQFCVGDDDSQPAWDTACLQAYMKHGGTTVIYVGERQRVLQERYGTNESGMSATLQFQRLLEESFDLQTVVSIPRLWWNDDDLTVWTRKVVGTDELCYEVGTPPPVIAI